MYIDPFWVTENKKEIEREAYRLHRLREQVSPIADDPIGNFIQAIENVWKAHERKRLEEKLK